MADISKNAEIDVEIDGTKYEGLVELHDVTIKAVYEDVATGMIDSVQPDLTIEEFTFSDEAKVRIDKHFTDGLTGGVGIFEGLPFALNLFNNTTFKKTFKSYIALTEGYTRFIQDGKITTGTIKDDGVDNFFEQLGVTTYGYLESIGAVTKSDYQTVNYVVEKKFNLIEILTTSLVLYMMIKELAEAIERTSNNIADVAALSIASITSAPAAAILAVLKAIISAVYTAILLLTIIELGRTLLNTLLPPKRVHKVITVRRALEVVCEHFGYTLNAPIDELNYLVYLPSNPRQDDKDFFGFISKTNGTPTGIPNVLDYGYNCAEMFQLVKDDFKAKISIVNKVVNIIPKKSNFWVTQSTWTPKSVEIQTENYNTSELKALKELFFQVDINDDWTIDNYEGTAYEIKTEPKTIINKNAVLLKGLEEVDFRTALPTRKDELNAMQRQLATVAGAIDGLTGVFGSGTNFAAQIKSQVGILKQSNNWHTVPKLLYLKNNKLPINYKDLFSAKVLYEKYHSENSFVLNNGAGQKITYSNVKIPFGAEDYEQVVNNGYFKYNGADANFVEWEWKPSQDFAIATFKVRQKYTNNLLESYVNPS